MGGWRRALWPLTQGTGGHQGDGWSQRKWPRGAVLSGVSPTCPGVGPRGAVGTEELGHPASPSLKPTGFLSTLLLSLGSSLTCPCPLCPAAGRSPGPGGSSSEGPLYLSLLLLPP